MSLRTPKKYLIAAIAASMLSQTSLALEPSGKVILSKGKVVASVSGNDDRVLRRGKPVFDGETINTGPGALLQMSMKDGALIALSENSRFIVSNYQDGPGDNDENVLLEIVQGGFRAVTGAIGKKNPAAVKVQTDVASIGIRGTAYEVFNIEGAIYIAVLEGTITVSNQAGSLDIGELGAYEFARVDSDSSAPEGLLALSDEIAALNPFNSGMIRRTEDFKNPQGGYQVPLDELFINQNPIDTIMAYNPSEQPSNLTLTPEVVDNSSDNTGTVTTDFTPTVTDISNALTAGSRVIYTTDNTYSAALASGDQLASSEAMIVLNGSNADSYSALKLANATNADNYPKTSAFDANITWGWWQGSDQAAIGVFTGTNNPTSTDLAANVYWVEHSAPLKTVTGVYQFYSTRTLPGSGSDGTVTSTSASMQINFDSGVAENGVLNVFSTNHTWLSRFSGALSTDAEGNLLGDFTLTGDDTALTGKLLGYFSQQTELFFSGAYSISDATADANGLLSMQGYEHIVIYGGDGTVLNQLGNIAAFEGSGLLFGPSIDLASTQLGYNGVDSFGTNAGWIIDLANANVASGTPQQMTNLGPDVYWGVWQATDSLPANLSYFDINGDSHQSSITSDIHWMDLTPSAVTRSGTFEFASTGDFIGSGTTGAVTALSGSFTFDFDNALVSAGSLAITTEQDNWQFNVADADSASINLSQGLFQIKQTQVSANTTTGVFGNVSGYFTDNGDGVSAAFGLFKQGDSAFIDTVNGLFGMRVRTP